MYSTAPFVPQFGTGVPTPGTLPTNQLYFDTTATPYTGYVWNVALGQFKSFGDNPSAIGLPVTQGSVLFGSASGVIGQDNSRLFWDDTNFRLGIMTSAPDSPFSILQAGAVTPIAGAVCHISTTNSTAFLVDSVGITPAMIFRRTNTSLAAPSALLSGQSFSSLQGRGYDGTAYSLNAGAVVIVTSENWSNAAHGSDMTFNLVAPGTTTVVAVERTYGDGRNQHNGAYVDLSYSYQTPATGFAILIGDTVGRLLLNPAGALATGTITLPANPKDGQVCKIKSSLAVAALTLNPSAGQTIADPLTALVAGQMYEFTYVASVTKWV